MGIFTGPPDRNDGETITGTIFNALKKAIQDFLNNGGLGDVNISTNPSEKIPESKLSLTAATGSHKARHEPGGADEINDIDILNTGTLLSVHGSRHAAGGPDPLPPGVFDGSLFPNHDIPNEKLLNYKDAAPATASRLGLTHVNRVPKRFNLSSGTFDPRGNGVVRSGKVYFSLNGASPDAVLKWDIAAGTESTVPLASGDNPGDLVLIGTNIYVVCEGTLKIKKIDANDVVTTLIDINADPTGPGDFTLIEHLVADTAGANLFVNGARSGGDRRELLRVNIATADLTHHVAIGGIGDQIDDLVVVKGSTTEYLIVLVEGNTVANEFLYRRNPADLTAVDSLDLGDPTQTEMVFDGHYLVTFQTVGPNLVVFNVAEGSIFQVASVAAPGGAPSSNFPNRARHFDGRYIIFGTATESEVCLIPALFYKSGMNLKVTTEVNHRVSGIASDGNDIWLAMQTTGTNQAALVRLQARV